jgi:hypothetical protein
MLKIRNQNTRVKHRRGRSGGRIKTGMYLGPNKSETRIL